MGLQFSRLFALYQQLDCFKNVAGLYTNADLWFLLCWVICWSKDLSYIFGWLLMRERRPSDRDVRTIRRSGQDSDEFREQFPFIRELLDQAGIRHYELAQQEADDIIGTLDSYSRAGWFWYYHCQWGQGFDSVDGWAYGGWNF